MSIPRNGVVIGVWLLFVTVATARADDSLLTQLTRSGNFRLHFTVANGRVRLDSARTGNMRTTRSQLFGKKETVEFNNENGRPTLDYEQTTKEEQFSIQVKSGGDEFCIRRKPRGKASFTAVEFQQVVDGNPTLTLTSGSGKEQLVLRASDFWQLIIAHPRECREHLLPLLEHLRADWKLAETAADVEKNLLQAMGNGAIAKRARWAMLVKQLGDDSFAKRKAADRALRASVRVVLCYLRQLDFDRLYAEQQFRIRRTVRFLTRPGEDDSAEEIAVSLAGDPVVWLALLARPEQATRQTAARQLALLLGEPVKVDPAAEPDTQKDQRGQLRVKIEGS